VDLIGQLFAVEKQAKDVSVAERLALLQTQSVPVLARIATQVASCLLDDNTVAELTLCRVCCSTREEQRSTRFLTESPF
jgi:hypothetical protein